MEETNSTSNRISLRRKSSSPYNKAQSTSKKRNSKERPTIEDCLGQNDLQLYSNTRTLDQQQYGTKLTVKKKKALGLKSEDLYTNDSKSGKVKKQSGKPPILFSSSTQKNEARLQKILNGHDHNPLLSSKDSEMMWSRLSYPDYLDNNLTPHKSCQTCKKINNFITVYNSQSRDYSQQDAEYKEVQEFDETSKPCHLKPSPLRHRNKKENSKVRSLSKKQLEEMFEELKQKIAEEIREQLKQPIDEVMNQCSQNSKKLESFNKDIELLTMKIEHMYKQIDSQRNKEFYQQANENQLLDNINQNIQQLRTFKQTTQQQIQTIEEELREIKQQEPIKLQIKDLQKQIGVLQQNMVELKEDSGNKNEKFMNLSLKIDMQHKEFKEIIDKQFQQEKQQTNAELNQCLELMKNNVRKETLQIMSKHTVDIKQTMEEIINKKIKEIDLSSINIVIENIKKEQNIIKQEQKQIQDMLKVLDKEFHQDYSQTTSSFSHQLENVFTEIKSLAQIVQEQEKQNELLFQTNQKKMELLLKEELLQREEILKGQFEGEKQDFLKAIQDNMQMLDLMLKEYTDKAQMHFQKRSVVNVSPQGDESEGSSKQQENEQNSLFEENSILRSSCMGSIENIHQTPLQDLNRGEARVLLSSGQTQQLQNLTRSRQQNIVVQEFLQSNAKTIHNNQSNMYLNLQDEGDDNDLLEEEKKEKANSVDGEHLEEFKVEVLSPFRQIGKRSESLHSHSGGSIKDNLSKLIQKDKKSSKASTIGERTISDLFNLTQESQYDIPNNNIHHLIMNSIEQRFGKLGNDIIEQLYVNEVIESLDLCFGLADDRNKIQSNIIRSSGISNAEQSDQNTKSQERKKLVNHLQHNHQQRRDELRIGNLGEIITTKEGEDELGMISHEYSDRYELSLSND